MPQPSTPPSKRERRDAARAERQAREQAAAAEAVRRKRLRRLGIMLAAVVAVIVIAIVVSSGGGKKTRNASTGGSVTGAAATTALFAGIPQSGITVGKPNAPVTIVEFADPQCPYCGAFSRDELPAVVRDQVRTGKAKLQMRMLTFLGPDSVTAGHALTAAGLQNKLWNATDLFYANQGEENTGYVTDAFLRSVLGAVPGLNVDKVFQDASSAAVTAQLGEAKTLASRYAVNGTPTILVGPSNGTLVKDGQTTPTAAGIAKLVDAASAKQ